LTRFYLFGFSPHWHWEAQSNGEKARIKTMIKSRNLTTDFYFISRSQLLPASLAFVRLRPKVKSTGSKNKQPEARRRQAGGKIKK
jgi:hypothetical protein